MVLLVGCTTIEFPCSLGWDNETHFCNEYHRREEKFNPNELYINQELLDNLRYHIEIDCKWVMEHLDNDTVWFPNQTIELCLYVYPDLQNLTKK